MKKRLLQWLAFISISIIGFAAIYSVITFLFSYTSTKDEPVIENSSPNIELFTDSLTTNNAAVVDANLIDINEFDTDKAFRIYNQLLQAQVEKDFETLNTIYADTLIKCHTLENCTKADVLNDFKKYVTKWTPTKIKIESFAPIDSLRNQFAYQLRYHYNSANQKRVYSYHIAGIVGFIKDEDTFKINYIDDFNQTELTANNRMRNISNGIKLNFNEYAKDTKGQRMTYSAKILLFPEIKNEYLLSHLYQDFTPLETYLNASSPDFRKQLRKQAQDFFESVYDNDAHNDTHQKIEMKMTFKNAHYITISTTERYDYGGQMGGSVGLRTEHRIINYRDEYPLELSDIIYPEAYKYDFFEELTKNYAYSYDKRIEFEDLSFEKFNIEESYYLENFHFDKNNLYIIFGKYTIAAGYAGNITLKIPWKDIDDKLTPTFKKNRK